MSTDQEWATEQLNAIEPTRPACVAFDTSPDGARYLQIVGMTMSENLGAHSLPDTLSDEAEDENWGERAHFARMMTPCF